MGKRLAFSKRSHAITAATTAALFVFATAPVEAGCGTKSVVLYSAYWCGFCKQVRGMLAGYHVRYNLQEASTTRVQASMLRRFGNTYVPKTVIGGVVVEGVNQARMKQLLCLR